MSKKKLSTHEVENDVSEIRQTHQTNVRRIYEFFPTKKNTSEFYFPGLGTMAHDSVLGKMDFSNLVARLGIERRIRRAYEYIYSKYDLSARNLVSLHELSLAYLQRRHGYRALRCPLRTMVQYWHTGSANLLYYARQCRAHLPWRHPLSRRANAWSRALRNHGKSSRACHH
ncbi:hypothetical protein BDV95DRAFT_141962 [Massariosphaeria phaeospora]|uniref:Uncharacterized protein n=1 Tax=Massariosphaeria phaeospora TaxID=100035 RepID=A0A7C8IGT4_9PLEO|nr:hypothetical protein BDV95DRAFT_141962 [Massariosphaeria phaeospora]